jgi:hypothetical protein
VIDTNSGMVQVYGSSNYLYLRIIERAINKAVRNYILENADKRPVSQEIYNQPNQL